MKTRMAVMLAETLNQVEEIKLRNKEQIEKARDMYWDSCKYPRKKKKAMRKKALKDFAFWTGINIYYNSLFS